MKKTARYSQRMKTIRQFKTRNSPFEMKHRGESKMHHKEYQTKNKCNPKNSAKHCKLDANTIYVKGNNRTTQIQVPKTRTLLPRQNNDLKIREVMKSTKKTPMEEIAMLRPEIYSLPHVTRVKSINSHRQLLK